MSKYLICTLLAITISIHVLGASNVGDVELNDTAFTQLKEVEIQADKKIKDLKSSIASKSISAEEFKKTGITDVADALRRMPGINMRDYGGNGGLKTISVRGLDSKSIGIIYDGAPLTDIQSGQIDLSRYSIEKIESLILRIGDADDINMGARNALMGANLTINSLPFTMIDRPVRELNVTLRAASFGTINPLISFQSNIGKNFLYSVSGEFLHSKNNFPFTLKNGDLVTKETRKNSRINSANLEANFLARIAINHNLKGKLYYYNNDRLLPGPVIYYVSASNQQLKEQNFFGQLDYNGQLSDKFSLRGTFKYNRFYTRYTDRDGRYPGGLLDDYYIQSEEYVSLVGLYNPVKGLKLSLASDYIHNDLNDVFHPEGAPCRNMVLEALSAQYQNNFITANLKGVFSYVEDFNRETGGKHFARMSPSASISVKLLRSHNFFGRLSYKNIFRMPTFNELYFQHYGTINLQPEISNQFNLGLNYSFSSMGIMEYFLISVDGYANQIKDKIVAVPYNMFLWTMTNWGKVLSTGLDISLMSNFRPAEEHSILLNGSYSYNKALQRTDPNAPDWNCQLPYTPVNSGSASLSWLNPWVNLTVHAFATSSRYSTAMNVKGTEMPGYWDAGLTLYRDFTIRKSSWEIRFDILNLFNTQYELVRRYPMPGRAFNLTLKYNLKLK